MTEVMIRAEESRAGEKRYRAVSVSRTSTGRTAGEALDSLLAGLDVDAWAVPVLVQPFSADQFFTQEQYDRMQALLARGEGLSPAENRELDALLDAELQATMERTAHLLPHAKP